MASKLFASVASQDVHKLRQTISLNASVVNSTNPQGSTPLHVACTMGWHEGVRELLRAKAAHDAVDKDGNTPLHLAAEQGSVHVLTELLTGQGRKLVVKAKNKEGRTPLHLAAQADHPQLVVKLVEAGARGDAKDKAGLTPLQLVPNLGSNEVMVAALAGVAPAVSDGGAAEGAACDAPIPSASPEKKDSKTPVAAPRPKSAASPAPSGATPPTAPRPTASPAISAFSMRASQQIDGGSLRRAAGLPAPATSRAAPVTPGGRPASGGGSLGTPGGATSAGQMVQLHEAAIVELKNHVRQLHAGLEEARSRAAVAEAAASAQKELAAQLTAAMEVIRAQSSRLEEVESRLVLTEERGREVRARLDRSDDAAKDERETAGHRHKAQDTALKALQASIARMSEEQHASQTLVGSLSQHINKMASTSASSGGGALTPRTTPHGGANAGSRGTSDGGDDSLQSDVQGLKSSVAALRGVPERTDELALQVAQLGASRGALSGELDTLRGRLTRLEDVGAADRLELLQLKVSQLGTSLSGLTNSQSELADKVTVLNRWKAEQQAVVGGGVVGTAAGAQAVLSVSAAPAFKELEAAVAQQAQQLTAATQQVESLVQQVTELKQAVADLPTKVTAAAAPTTPAPSTPTPGPRTPHELASSKRHALNASMNANAEREVQELTGDVHQLQGTVAELKTALDEARSEMRLAALELKREWEGAVAEAGARFAEQRAEMEAREARVKAMKDSVLKEEEARAKAFDFEKSVKTSMGKLETSLGLVQHKVEVLEEAVQGLQQRPRSSIAGTSHDDNMHSSRNQSYAGGHGSTGAAHTTQHSGSGRAGSTYAGQHAAAHPQKSHQGGPGPVGEETCMPDGHSALGCLLLEHAVSGSLAQIIHSPVHSSIVHDGAVSRSPQLGLHAGLSSPLAKSATTPCPAGLSDRAGRTGQAASLLQQHASGPALSLKQGQHAAISSSTTFASAAATTATTTGAAAAQLQWVHHGAALPKAASLERTQTLPQTSARVAQHNRAHTVLNSVQPQGGSDGAWSSSSMPYAPLPAQTGTPVSMQEMQMRMAQSAMQAAAAGQLGHMPHDPSGGRSSASTPGKQPKEGKAKAPKEKQCAVQ